MKILAFMELVQEERLNKGSYVRSVPIPAKRKIKKSPVFALILRKVHGFASIAVGQEDSI
jgi:hypothetical protein